MFRTLSLPIRLAYGASRLSAKAGYTTGKLTARTGYRTTRRIGLGRIAAFGAGVGVGMLAAPTSGAEMRERLRDRLESRREPADDREIADRVRQELAQSPRTWHLPQPEVEVVGGTAVLTGEAPHATGKSEIERAVAAIPGIVEVDSRLVVVGAPPDGEG